MIGDMESTLLIDAAYRANFDLPQIPEPDGSYVLNQKLWYVYKEKARESVPVTHPALWGLRIAHPVRTSNAEAHADMYNNTWIHLWPTKAHQGYKHTPQTSTVALSLTAISKGANFRSVKNKTSSKRLFYICIFPTSLTSLRKYRRGKRDKDSNLINRTKIYSAILVMFLDYSKTNKKQIIGILTLMQILPDASSPRW